MVRIRWFSFVGKLMGKRYVYKVTMKKMQSLAGIALLLGLGGV